jgi:hypothetical protein
LLWVPEIEESLAVDLRALTVQIHGGV